MKKSITSLFFALALTVSVQAMGTKDSSSKKTDNQNARQKEVVVYAYDSFAADWGAGPSIAKKFEEATGYKVTILDLGDAIETYSRAVLEKNNVQADVILGIDNNLVEKAKKDGILEAYKPKNADNLDPELQKALGGGWYLTPYDYSHFAMIYDTQSATPAPTSLEDLTKDIYKKKIILMDPRTSTPGLGFLSWTVSVYGDKYTEYWQNLKNSILTMTSGWSEGWGMFLAGEAPLVISYTTSPAYNVEYDKNYRYKALVFDQGHVQQVEGLGLLKGAPNKKGGQAFIDFMISEAAQNELPLAQWMYPVNKNVELPNSYKEAAPIPAKTLSTNSEKTSKAVNVVTNVLSK